jgi:uncharacterized protein
MITKEEVYKLHQKYCHGKYYEKVLEICWTHSLIVAEIGLMLAKKVKTNFGIEVDNDLVEIGGLVHDVGVYSCFDDNFKLIDKYVRHAFLGYKILKKEGIEEKVARFALVHLGVGIYKEQIIQDELDLPKKDLIPISLEEEIITYADGFHSKNEPGFNSYKEQEEKMNKRLVDYKMALLRFKKKFGLPDLSKIEEKYKEWHKEINKWVLEFRH